MVCSPQYEIVLYNKIFMHSKCIIDALIRVEYEWIPFYISTHNSSVCRVEDDVSIDRISLHTGFRDDPAPCVLIYSRIIDILRFDWFLS